MTAVPLFDDLNNEQANGIACIVCGTDYTTSDVYSVPVGYSARSRLLAPRFRGRPVPEP